MKSTRNVLLYSLALLTALWGILADVRADDKTAGIYLEAYTAFQRAEQMERDGKNSAALAEYQQTLKMLRSLQENFPDWQPPIVQYRIEKSQQSIERLKAGNVSATPEPAPQDNSPEGPLPTKDKIAPAPPVIQDEPSVTTAPTVKTGREEQDDSDVSVDSDGGKSTSREVRNLRAKLRQANERELQAVAEKKSYQVALDKTKVEKVELKARVAELQEAVENLKSDFSAKDKSDGKIAQEVAKLREVYRQALADHDVLEENYQSTAEKLDRAAKYIATTDSQRDSLVKERDIARKEKTDAEKKLKAIKDNTKEINRLSTENKEIAQKLADAEKKLKLVEDEAENAGKLSSQNKDLTAQNKTLTEQLTETEKKLKLVEESAKEIEKLSTDNKTLSDKLTEAEKKISEMVNIGPEKDKVIADLQSELNGVKDQLLSAQTQLQQKDTQLSDVEKQLDQTAGELASLRLNPVPTADEKRAKEENELLRGIVLRQLKEQARRAQVRKLIEEEVQRLQVKSTTLDDQLAALSNESLLQTDEEKALFKDPQIMLADAGDQTVSATVAVLKSEGGSEQPKKEGDSAQASASPEGLPSDMEPLIQQAKELFNKGNFAEAEKVYVKILETSPDNYYALANYGVTEFQLGRLSAAEVALRRAITVNPKGSFAFTVLGIVNFRQGKFDEAIDTLSKAIELDPKDSSAHNYLGITLSNKGDTTRAAKEIEAAIKLKPDYADAHFNLAVIYATSQPPDKALARHHYQKAISLGAQPDPALERLLQDEKSASIQSR